MKITELCIRRSRSYLYKLTGSGGDLTLSDCDTFTPASQLMRLALYDEYPNTALSDQVSLDEPASDQASLEPWDEWQSWDDTDTYEDPGIPSIEMMLWENSERERRANELTARTSFEDDSVISPQTSDIDFPLPHPNPSQTAHGSGESSDQDVDDEDNAPKR